MQSLNCLFIVQGEGRGHMTQALALRRLLLRAGHAVSGVVVGRSERREVPEFFLDKIGAPVSYIESPNFVLDGDDRSIRLLPTARHNLGLARRFLGGFDVLDAQLRLHRPDVVVNFVEPLAGLYYGRYRPGIPMVCIGHHYLSHHPAYPFPPGQRLNRWLFRTFNDVTAMRAARRLALSFYPGAPVARKRLVVVPPLLREEVRRQLCAPQEPFFLVYLLNSGYADEVVRWHTQHPDVRLHCFWDRRDATDEEAYDDTLTFHRLSDEKFLALMGRCSGLVTTAGFESICEAMYLGKPVLMVPVEGHFEQQCNARDATGAGAGLWSRRFDISLLLNFLPQHRPPPSRFRLWADQAGDVFVREIASVAHAHSADTRRTLAAA